jgi:integrase-like protein
MYVKANRNSLVIAYIPLRGKFITQPLHLRDSRPNRTEANRIKRELEHALHTGSLEAALAKRFPNSKRLRGLTIVIPRDGHPTLGQYALEWLAEKTQLTPATRYDYESLINTHIIPHPISVLPLLQIDEATMTAFVNQTTTKTLPKDPERTISHRRVNMVILC